MSDEPHPRQRLLFWRNHRIPTTTIHTPMTHLCRRALRPRLRYSWRECKSRSQRYRSRSRLPNPDHQPSKRQSPRRRWDSIRIDQTSTISSHHLQKPRIFAPQWTMLILYNHPSISPDILILEGLRLGLPSLVEALLAILE